MSSGSLLLKNEPKNLVYSKVGTIERLPGPLPDQQLFCFYLHDLSELYSRVILPENSASFLESTILYDLNGHRESLYIIFGILCLVFWLLFNLYAVRDYFCPVFFNDIYSRQKRLDSMRDEFFKKTRLSSVLLQAASEGSTIDDLSIFIV